MRYTAISETEFNTRYQLLLDYSKVNEDKTLPEIKNGLKNLPKAHALKDKNLFVLNRENRKSFLHKAAAVGDWQFITFLKETGHDINLTDGQHKTALYDACDHLKLAAVNHLLGYDADPNLGNGHLKVKVKELYKGGEQEFTGETVPLVATIESEATVTAAEFSAATGEDFSQLTTEHATEQARARIAKSLIAKNANVNLQTGKDNLSALLRAIERKKPLIVKEINDSGRADFRLVNRAGETALHIVVEYRNKEEKENEQLDMQKEKEIAELIIPHLEALDIQEPDGNTPLHAAVICSNVDVVEAIYKNDYLFLHRKILSIQNKEGNSAIHEALLAAKRGPKILNLLLRVATEDELDIRNNPIIDANGFFIRNAETVKEMATRLKIEAESVRGLIDTVESAASDLDNLSGSVSIPKLENLKAAISSLEKNDAFNNADLSNKLDLDMAHLSYKIDEYKRITDNSLSIEEEIDDLVSLANEFVIDARNEFFDTNYESFAKDYQNYLNSLESVHQSEYLKWKAEQLLLEGSFSDPVVSPNYYAELTQANNKFGEALKFLGGGDNVNAQMKLEESINLYDSLKEYSSLETAYEYLASTYINIGETANYEARNQAKLHFSSNNAKLRGHLALAGLYKVLKARNLSLLPSVSAEALSAYESFHYSEAYKGTQGNLDNDAYIVLQREIGVANNVKLGTFNIQQCVAVIAHDPSTGKVVLSHFDRYSGPLKFIDQILQEFPNTPKIDLYLTGGRDRVTTVSSTSTTKISDNNINQVLKQIHAHKDRFTIKASDLGDKPSPEAVVFHVNSAQLEHRMPNHEDISFNSRAAMMNIQLNKQMLQKGDYLHPLNRVDFSQDQTARKKSFSAEQLKTFSDNCHRYYDNRPGFSEAWKHNQIFHPLIVAIKDTSTPGNPYDFEQGLFKDLATPSDTSSAIQLPFDFDMSYLQQNTQPHPDLINEISIQNYHNLLQTNQDEFAIEGDEFDDIDTEQDIDIDDIEVETNTDDDFAMSTAAKRRCFSSIKRRAVDECSLSRDMIDSINISEDKANIHTIDIDSSLLLEAYKRMDETSRTEVLKLAASCNISGDKKSIVRRLIQIERFKPHLKLMSEISSGLTQGMMAKDILAALFKDDGKTVAINLGFMGAGHGLGMLSKLAATKGEGLIAEGENLLGKSLKISTPFLSRGTSLFMAYDLVKQVKALESGDKDAIVGVVGDSLMLGADLAAAGIEVAEFAGLEVLAGISSVAGPAGQAVGGIIMLGMQIYNAVRSVARLDHLMHLSGWEKFKEGWRAFLGMASEEYIQKALDLIEHYKQFLGEKLEFLKSHPEIKHYIFAALEQMGEECRMVTKMERPPFRSPYDWYAATQPPMEKTIKKECVPVFGPVENNSVDFGGKRNDFKLTRALPTNPDPSSAEFTCLPLGDDTSLPKEGAYRCNAALGLTNKNATGNLAYIALSGGNDVASGFENIPNYIEIKNGNSFSYGGFQSDTFILLGEEITGVLMGSSESDNLVLSGFLPKVDRIEIDFTEEEMRYGNKILRISGIEKLFGSSLKAYNVTADCDTQVLDTQGGPTINNPDKILIPNNPCNYEMRVLLTGNVVLTNEASTGNFNYDIESGAGEISVDLPRLEGSSTHKIVFNATNTELSVLSMQRSKDDPLRQDVKFQFDHFKLDVNSVLSNNTLFYFKDGVELKLGDKNPYLFYNTDQSLSTNINHYATAAHRLNITCVIQGPQNEVAIIGHSKHEVMHNDPRAHRTHLHGNGGEGLFVIDSGLAQPPFSPLGEVVIYHSQGDSHVDTLDLRTLTAQIRTEFNATAEIIFVPPNASNRLGDDMLLLLAVKSTWNNAVKEFMTIRVKDALIDEWYKDLHIILHVAPLKVVGPLSNLSLVPVPLEFKKSYQIIKIGIKDVEENTLVIIPRNYASYKYFRDKDNLRLTNALSNDSTIPFTILLENFYAEPKLKTLSFKFLNKTIILKKQIKKINAAADWNKAQIRHERNLYAMVFNQLESSGNNASIAVQSSNDSTLIETEIDVNASNTDFHETNNTRQRRAAEHSEERMVTNAAPRYTGILQTMVNTVKSSMPTIFSSNTQRNSDDKIFEIAEAFDRKQNIKAPTQKKGSKQSKKIVVETIPKKTVNHSAKPIVATGNPIKNAALSNKPREKADRIQAANNITKANPFFCGKQKQVQPTFAPKNVKSNHQPFYDNQSRIKMNQAISGADRFKGIENKTGDFSRSQLAQARLADNQHKQHNHYQQQPSGKSGITKITAPRNIDGTLLLFQCLLTKHRPKPPMPPKVARWKDKIGDNKNITRINR